MTLIGKTLIDINRLVAVTRANDAVLAAGNGTATIPLSPEEAEELRFHLGQSIRKTKGDEALTELGKKSPRSGSGCVDD